MDLFLKIMAMTATTLVIVNVLLIPRFFGKSKGTYEYTSFVAAVIEASIVILLALRVLKII